MKLDFTKLNSIGKFNTAQEATKSPTSRFAEKCMENNKENNKENGKYASEGIQELQRQADQNKTEAKRIKEVYKNVSK